MVLLKSCIHPAEEKNIGLANCGLLFPSKRRTLTTGSTTVSLCTKTRHSREEAEKLIVMDQFRQLLASLGHTAANRSP